VLRRVWALCALLLIAASAAGSARADSSLFFGFSDDRPKWEGVRATAPVRELGASAVRVAVRWDGTQTLPDAAQIAELDQAVNASEGLRIVFAVVGPATSAPQTDAGRDAFCTFAQNVVGRYPAVRDVIIWGEPNKATFWRPQFNADASSAAAPAYAALAARCWDTLHAAHPSINVLGPALAPNGNDNPGATSNVSHSPGAFIRTLGEAYRASGRTAPLFDTFAHHIYGATPAERPWRQHIGSKIIAQGDWNKLMYNFWLAFNGTAQPIPGQCSGALCTSLWYTEGGYETRPDDAKLPLYAGTEIAGSVLADWVGGEPESPAPTSTSSAPDQATQILDGARLAYCQPYVGAFFNFLVWDEARLEGWQSGAYWADLSPKDSQPLFRQAIGAVNGDAVDCAALKGGLPSSDYFPPSAPTGTAATVARDPLRVTVTWNAAADNVGATSYRIYRNGAQIGTTSATSWVDFGVADSTTYSYTIRALDAAGNMGDASTAATVTTPDLTAPTTPTNLAASAASPTQVNLSWTPSTDKVGVAGYHVYRDGVYLASTATASYADATVRAATTYSYAVSAYDAAGNVSAATPFVQVTTPPAEVTRTYAPASFTLLAGGVYAGRGDVSRLANDDAVHVEISAAKSASTYIADLYTSTRISESPSAVKRLTVAYDGHASSTSASVTLSVFNWRTGGWQTVDGPRAATTTDRGFSWVAPAPADVLSPSGELRFRIRATRGSAAWFITRTDLVRVTVTS
jgi:chitodextrinase